MRSTSRLGLAALLMVGHVAAARAAEAPGGDGPVVLVTGAFRGLGREIVTQALGRGQRVIATGRSIADAADLVRAHPDRLLAVELDLARPETFDPAIARGLARFGRIDAVVHNAGVMTWAPTSALGRDELERAIVTNATGPMELTARLRPVLTRAPRGRVIYVSSMAAAIAQPGYAAYSSSKAAGESYFETLGRELRDEPGPLTASVVSLGFLRSTYEPKVVIGAAANPSAGGAQGRIMKFLRDHSPTTERRAASRILDQVERPRSRLRVDVGLDAKLLRHMPRNMIHSATRLVARAFRRR